jgi:hypothetical protein
LAALAVQSSKLGDAVVPDRLVVGTLVTCSFPMTQRLKNGDCGFPGERGCSVRRLTVARSAMVQQGLAEIEGAAGISENVWNMDNRASGITEASEAGVPDDDLIKQSGRPKR